MHEQSVAKFRVSAEDNGKRLDICMVERLSQVSRATAQRLIDSGHVRVNGRAAKASQRVRVDDEVEVEMEAPPPLAASPQDIPLNIVYQDQDLAVLDKPAGLVVHPAPGHRSGTLANALAAMYPQARSVGDIKRPGIVHRLDKDTSGLMVVALNPTAHLALQKQIQERLAQRLYLALLTGHIEPREGIVRAPVGRDPIERKRMAVHGAAARPAETSYRVLEYLPGFSLIEAKLHTGRTHQIRVHTRAAGHPVAGDRLYGGAALKGLERQFLHAYSLSFRSPSTGDQFEFVSQLPPDLHAILRGVGSGFHVICSSV